MHLYPMIESPQAMDVVACRAQATVTMKDLPGQKAHTLGSCEGGYLCVWAVEGLVSLEVAS